MSIVRILDSYFPSDLTDIILRYMKKCILTDDYKFRPVGYSHIDESFPSFDSFVEQQQMRRMNSITMFSCDEKNILTLRTVSGTCYGIKIDPDNDYEKIHSYLEQNLLFNFLDL